MPRAGENALNGGVEFESFRLNHEPSEAHGVKPETFRRPIGRLQLIAGAARVGRGTCPDCRRRRLIYSAVLAPAAPRGCFDCLLARRAA